MGRTMHTVLEGPANALDLCKDCTKVVVAGRSVFKIYSIEDEEFVERDNLRVGKNINLNFSCNDVVWSPIDDQLIATAATNGAVVVWNLNKSGRSKQEHLFIDHKRTVNKVNFHPTEAGLLISGSQDGTMKLFDMRLDKPSETFHSNTESVRDVQFNPHAYWQFSAVSENGKVQLWDIRRADRCEKQWPAHNNHVFACDWHPEVRNLLATAGRDKTIKVWDTVCKKGDKMHGLEHTINTIGPVGRVKWRPQRRDYLGSSALCIDFAVNVWDIKRPFVPFAAFNQHKDVTTDIAWRGDPHTLLSTSKDGTLYQHTFSDAVRPGDKANPVGLSFSVGGDLTHAYRHVPRNTQNYGVLPASKGRGGAQEIFRKHINHSELFRMCNSRLVAYHPPPFLHSKRSHEVSIETVTAEIAKRYKLLNTSLADACDINAEVAKSLSRKQVALTWTMLKTLYACTKSDTARPVSGDIAAGAGDGEGGDRSKLRLRSASGMTRRVSGKQPALKVVSHGTGRDSVVPAKDGTSDSEDDEEFLDNCQTLTEIASGYTVATITGDFFGDSELAGLGVEGLVSLEGGGVGGGGINQQIMQEWVLPSEAFEQRHEIKDGGVEKEDLVVGDSGDNMQTVTVEDKTSDVVVWGVHAQDTRQNWSPNQAVSQALTWLAEQGDVQNAVSMYIALAGGRTAQADRVRGLVNNEVLEHWFLSYVELLQKLELFTKANEILSQCPLPAVHTMNQQSTTVYTACTKCGKSLARNSGAWWCERCRAPPARCAVCHAVVKGLYVWCQGCGHGGHIHCIKKWFERRTTCPTGCGHHCQYN